MELLFICFFNNHNLPHFKVKFGEFEANIIIDNGSLLNGDFPMSKLKLVQVRVEIHIINWLRWGQQKIFIKLNLFNNA